MRIEVLEERLSDTDADTGVHRLLVRGDTLTVPDAYGRRLCALGWVKDLDGAVETGPRVPGAQLLTPRRKVVAGRTRG